MPEALVNSVVLCLGVAGVATLLGAPLGAALGYGGGALRRVLFFLLVAPLAIPPYVLAMAWIDVLGRNGILGRALGQAFEGPANLGVYSLPGAVIVMALGLYPIPLIATRAGMRGLDPQIHEAARLVGGRRAAWSRVVLPLLLPGISAGAVLVALLALLAFSVPSLLQTPVYSFEVYSRFSTGATLSAALYYATPLALFGVVIGGLWLYWVSHQMRSRSSRSASLPSLTGFSGVWFLLVCVGILLFLPVSMLLVKAWPMGNLGDAWATAWEELGTSLLLAAGAATGGTALGLALALGTRGRLGGLAWLSALPYLVSGPVLGIGLIYGFNAPGWRGAIYDSFGIMVIACVLRYVIFAHAGLYVALRLRARHTEDAAATLGAGHGRRLLRVTLPGVAPWIAGVWFLLFVFSFGEVDAVLLVAPPGWTPLSVRLFSLMHYGPSGLVYALSLLATVVTLLGCVSGMAVFAVLQRWSGGKD